MLKIINTKNVEESINNLKWRMNYHKKQADLDMEFLSTRDFKPELEISIESSYMYHLGCYLSYKEAFEVLIESGLCKP